MLELIRVTKKYSDDKNEDVIALNDVSLQLPDKGLVIINGTSGCGKTTLLNILGGLDRPTSGELRLDNVRIDNKDEKWWDSFRSYSLGFIYQDFNLLENMTVRENVQLPLNLQNLDEATIQERVCKITDELGLGEYIDKKTGKLSGGQKQRVAIARALVNGSKVILADEPTGNLDRQNSENVFKLLKKVAKNRLVIVVTHDSTLAKEYADRLIQINYGTIESDIVIEDNINNADDDSDKADSFYINESTESESKKNRLSMKYCLAFAGAAMHQRKMRCFISVLIFSITTLLVLVLCEAMFRNDSVSITDYVNNKNQAVVPLFMDIPDDYINLTEDDNITTGKKFYDLISQCADEDRIVRFGYFDAIELAAGKTEEANTMYVDKESEKYLTFEGKFPEKKYEIAISEEVADKLGNSDSLIGSAVTIDDSKYTITAIVTQLCGKDIKGAFLDDGAGGNRLKNLLFVSNTVLMNESELSYIYMSGFDVIRHSNLFYQATVYSDVCPADDEIELVAGRMPETDNEILISKSKIDMWEQSSEDIVGNVYKLTDFYGDKYGCAYWNMLNLYDYMGESFTVVGVAEGYGDYFVTPSLYNIMFEEFKTYNERPFYLLVDEKTFGDDIHRLMENGVKIKDPKLENVYMLIDDIDMIKVAMVIVVAVIALLSVLQMISLYSYSINDNKKTIGILRTMGVNKSDTKRIFTVECMLVSTVSFIIAIVICIFMTQGINRLLCDAFLELQDFSFLHMRLVVVLITGVVSCALSILSVLIPLAKYSKIKIIELIK